MTLTPEQAIAIVKERPNGKAIEVKQAKHQILKAHVTGIGDETLMKVIKNFERREYGETRIAMRMSNKDIIYRVMQPRNKIYSAKGGVETFTMKNMEQVQAFKQYLSCIRPTQSLKQYIQQNIQPMYDYDPEGLVWLDLAPDLMPYPCFKSIMQVWDYELNGRKPEYVVFTLSDKEIRELAMRADEYPEIRGYLVEPPQSTGAKNKKTKKVFRCVCDSFDRIIVKPNSGDPVIISEQPNAFAFMGVPGMIVSNLVGAGNDYEDIVYDSPLSPCTDILTQAMFGRSFFNIAYTKAVYPKEWMTKMPCPTCQGHKMVSDATCPECHGTGALPLQLHSDVLIIDYHNDANKSVPTPPMGHVDPAVEALRFMQETNSSWEDMFNYTMWGVAKVQTNSLMSKPAGHGGNVSGTAYEAQLNDQPKNDKLIEFSSWYSEVMKWYADGCGKYIYENDYIDSGIMGGTRFMIESADATFTRLKDARAGGASKSELDSLALEYLENKYQTNPLEYRKYYILFLAEPFVHDKISDVLSWDIPEINKQEKIFFDDWKATLTDEYFASCPDDGLVQKVKDDLRAYTLTRVSLDNAADSQLYTAMGQLLNVGDEVEVKANAAREKSHVGVTMKVNSVSGKFARLIANNGSEDIAIDGYAINELIKRNN